ILVPGISGTVLQKHGEIMWGISGRSFWNLIASRGDSLRELALPGDDPEADDVGDGIQASELIPDATLIPGLVKIDGYSTTAQMIRDRFLVEEGDLHVD